MECLIQFPDPLLADDEGIVAVGGELTSEYLISAYTQGVFPWFNEGNPILWWSPNPRLVLFPQKFKLRKSLKQVIRGNKFSVKIDTNFESVIKSCASIERYDQDGTWITNDIQEAYLKLHELGVAHSFETYNTKSELVGGLYGVSLGNAFFGESMFAKESDASKVALAHLVHWCVQNDYAFIDAQQSTQHLISLGAEEIQREEFIRLLNESLKTKTRIGKWDFEVPFSVEGIIKKSE